MRRHLPARAAAERRRMPRRLPERLRRMKDRENNLARLLSCAGFRDGDQPPPRPGRTMVEASRHALEVQRVFGLLGGVREYGTPAAWDCALRDFVVELDEERHFNRFRAITLGSSVYSAMPRFPLVPFREYCGTREQDCLRDAGYGGYWTNDSCDRMFGRAGPVGQIEPGNGPSRWKQRAFYDFLKDLAMPISGVPVVRVAVWDVLTEGKESAMLGRILREADERWAPALRRLVESRHPSAAGSCA